MGEEVGVPGDNPCIDGGNMQTPEKTQEKQCYQLCHDAALHNIHICLFAAYVKY